MQSFVGKKAPHFSTEAAIGAEFKHVTMEDFKGKYLCLFFYPLDFTFVCPTELHSFASRHNDFLERNCELVAASVDSKYSHAAWLRTPKTQGGIEGVNYPILADLHKSIARDYGVLDEEQGIALRGLFIIDREGVVQHATINTSAIGRNVEEVLRVLDALQHAETHGEVCPANWIKGDAALKANDAALREFFQD
jgi:peroxiredoxin (alkyl hydroperoxide reductase subunit C)